MIKTKSISFGDKIFARVSRNGQTIYNFVSEKVANMADLVNQIRRAMKDVRGLVIIHIRNYNQGWGDERPLMLYAPKNYVHNNFKPGAATYSHGSSLVSESASKAMLFPWETH